MTVSLKIFRLKTVLQFSFLCKLTVSNRQTRVSRFPLTWGDLLIFCLPVVERMFGQIFIALVGCFLMVTGALEKDYWNIALGAFVFIPTAIQLYELSTGKSFGSKEKNNRE